MRKMTCEVYLSTRQGAAQACGTSTRAGTCGLEGSVRKLKLRMLRVFSGKTAQASGAFTMVSTAKHAAQAREWVG